MGTIVNTVPLSNGAYQNQNGNVPAIPDGWIVIPNEFLAIWEQYKPFVTITVEDGAITSMVDNPDARTAQKATDAAYVPDPTAEEKLRADVDYIALMTGSDLI